MVNNTWWDSDETMKQHLSNSAHKWCAKWALLAESLLARLGTPQAHTWHAMGTREAPNHQATHMPRRATLVPPLCHWQHYGSTNSKNKVSFPSFISLTLVTVTSLNKFLQHLMQISLSFIGIKWTGSQSLVVVILTCIWMLLLCN